MLIRHALLNIPALIHIASLGLFSLPFTEMYKDMKLPLPSHQLSSPETSSSSGFSDCRSQSFSSCNDGNDVSDGESDISCDDCDYGEIEQLDAVITRDVMSYLTSLMMLMETAVIRMLMVFCGVMECGVGELLFSLVHLQRIGKQVAELSNGLT